MPAVPQRGAEVAVSPRLPGSQPRWPPNQGGEGEGRAIGRTRLQLVLTGSLQDELEVLFAFTRTTGLFAFDVTAALRT
ncbi:hypothetical protein GCM10010289_84930 [Streptomyces violascens]|uniref:Uncharacterized protein n=1 Tax=Streptomyces violascens TaxID=67381 RepID=A0ABQ3QS60_9ACTN|nr:hypothetical protein GCM10010289_84930 [Streptomyces violascens]GHI40104.1 hypothetical protein Sviol_45120 [Streptomyces violascens]